jgi:ethanolaminephosphotransferase
LLSDRTTTLTLIIHYVLEYYTGTLPHAAGNIGVTEVNYGFGMWWVLTGLITGTDIYNTELPFLDGVQIPLRHLIVEDGKTTLQLKEAAAIGWVYLMGIMSILSIIRVSRKVGQPARIASALSKLLSPGLICFVALAYFKQTSIRFQSLCMGYTICLITIKIIVFSMAKMAYASFQLEIAPFLAVTLYNHYTDAPADDVERSYRILAVWGLMRLLTWNYLAIQQLCKRLNIQLFKVKKRAE